MTIVLLLKSFLNELVQELKKEENFNDLQTYCLEPILGYIFKRLYPYIIISSAIFFLTFLTAIIILVLLLRKN